MWRHSSSKNHEAGRAKKEEAHRIAFPGLVRCCPQCHTLHLNRPVSSPFTQTQNYCICIRVSLMAAHPQPFPQPADSCMNAVELVPDGQHVGSLGREDHGPQNTKISILGAMSPCPRLKKEPESATSPKTCTAAHALRSMFLVSQNDMDPIQGLR